MHIIAIDAMGGDYGPRVTVPAGLACLDNPDLKLVFVGDAQAIKKNLPFSYDRSRVEVVHASQVIEMGDKPSTALRRKKDSSMYKALELVREGRAHGCVSSGNTGALMGIGRFLLKTLPGIDRPALISPIPSISGNFYMLDLGANINCDADTLFQFALMGSVMANVMQGKPRPRVALMNIGTEDIKGSETIKLAANMLTEAEMINFIGYIEGDLIYRNKADVVVCDGFVGNVALKTSEGLVSMVSEVILQVFEQNWYNRLVGILALPIIQKLKRMLNSTALNGASLIGLQGVVIKSHGKADRDSFAYAVQQALTEVRQDLVKTINDALEDMYR